MPVAGGSRTLNALSRPGSAAPQWHRSQFQCSAATRGWRLPPAHSSSTAQVVVTWLALGSCLWDALEQATQQVTSTSQSYCENCVRGPPRSRPQRPALGSPVSPSPVLTDCAALTPPVAQIRSCLVSLLRAIPSARVPWSSHRGRQDSCVCVCVCARARVPQGIWMHCTIVDEHPRISRLMGEAAF